MENFFLQAVVEHLAPYISGASLGRVWQPTEASLYIDFRLPDARFLYVSVDPSAPELYLTSRPLAEIERSSAADRAFAAALRKRARGAIVDAVTKEAGDRVVTIGLLAYDAAGARERLELVVELTGRSANAYLVDAGSTVVATLRPRPDDVALPTAFRASRRAPPSEYGPTLRAELEARTALEGADAAAASLERDLAAPGSPRLYEFSSPKGIAYRLSTFPLVSAGDAPVELFADPSAAADARSRRAGARQVLERTRRVVAERARHALARADRLADALVADLAATEGAERWRELAESLLAQVKSARVVDGGLELDDLYASEPARVTVEADRGEAPHLVAERLFARHRKARRTRERVAERSADVAAARTRIAELFDRAMQASTVAELDAVDVDLDVTLGVRRVAAAPSTGSARASAVSGARRFVSSDGFEILVGRSSAANDALTFKIARPSDLWLHAADYPGSHVVVRNPGRGDVPHRTIVEAAQLAAFYSDARGEALADVRYTPRRFVTKPRGGALGLARIAKFKTVAVRPAADLDRAT